MVTDNSVINELSYCNLVECGKTILNRIYATCKLACAATSRDRYYMEMFKTLTDYNYCNNTPLSNVMIRKFIKNESIADTNNVTADTFIHTLNTQIDNANAVFTSEKLDKSDELVDVVKNLTINNAKYYESNTATASNAQVDLTHNP